VRGDRPPSSNVPNLGLSPLALDGVFAAAALATCACASIETTLYAPVATTVPEIGPALRDGFVAELDRWLIEAARHR
jgi:hypothetical protein